MANEVYANGREVACKAGSGKVICATPDVCMTPPENPATPPGVPVPYPNTAMASDTTDGSTSVQISGQEVMLKNKSCFKTSTGDEAGAAAKKGVVSSKNKGKVYFIDWSMDVKFEGENAVRHLDKTTNNHGSPTANEAIPWPFVDKMTDAKIKALCDERQEDRRRPPARTTSPPRRMARTCALRPGSRAASTRSRATFPAPPRRPARTIARQARRCRLVPFNTPEKDQDGIKGCCTSQTGDHIVPKSSFFVRAVKTARARR